MDCWAGSDITDIFPSSWTCQDNSKNLLSRVLIWHVLRLSQTSKLSGGFKTWSGTKIIFVSAFYCRNLNLWFLKVFLSLRFKSCVWRCSSLFFLSHMNNWLLLTRLWPFISSSSVTRFYIWSRVFCREIGFHLCLSVSASRRKL